MNFKIAFVFIGIIGLEVLINFLLSLKYNCLFDFDYVCYNILEICKNFMLLLNYILIGSYVINYIVNDINEDEDLKEIICDVIVKKLQKKTEKKSENDSIEDSSESSLHESDIIYEDLMKSESEIDEENTEQDTSDNKTSELKQRNIQNKIDEIDVDKSIKDFSDMIQILVENRNETNTETHIEKTD